MAALSAKKSSQPVLTIHKITCLRSYAASAEGAHTITAIFGRPSIKRPLVPWERKLLARSGSVIGICAILLKSRSSAFYAPSPEGKGYK
jgi:hypothetical protein